MPFGLSNAVATFCHLMDKLFAAYQWEFVLCFIDNCLIFAKNDFNLHLFQIQKVFDKVKQANLRLKLKKCPCKEQSRNGPQKNSNIQGLLYPNI